MTESKKRIEILKGCRIDTVSNVGTPIVTNARILHCIKDGEDHKRDALSIKVTVNITPQNHELYENEDYSIYSHEGTVYGTKKLSMKINTLKKCLSELKLI